MARMKYTYEQLAKMLDHSLLHPTMTDAELEAGCRVAARYGVASVCIKPYAVRQAVAWLQGSGVLVGCVIGFPHGNAATEAKRHETELACRDGAAEIDMVVNLGKALSGDWDYVERDVRAVCDEAHRHGARVKVIFENDYLARGGAGLDELIRVRDLGATRCGATATAAMLDEYRRREAAERAGTATPAADGVVGGGGY
jgi:deoxyribose-phosphate aldolase